LFYDLFPTIFFNLFIWFYFIKMTIIFFY
jgi:hypothetical protein